MRTIDLASKMGLFLHSFTFPWLENKRYYPYSILYPKKLRNIEFDPITILYGSNGSGKSTIMNIIARKLGVEMIDKGNDSEYFEKIISGCRFISQGNTLSDIPDEDWGHIPNGSRFIRSEEVMHALIKVRRRNELIKLQLKGDDPELYEDIFVKGVVVGGDSRIAGLELFMDKFRESRSNGELAMGYFFDNIEPNTLVMLDEPENSLSPKFQKELADLILKYARYFKTQFIIATHSPFFLMMLGAKIYNLDAKPSKVCRPDELETIQLYKELFKETLKT